MNFFDGVVAWKYSKEQRYQNGYKSEFYVLVLEYGSSCCQTFNIAEALKVYVFKPVTRFKRYNVKQSTSFLKLSNKLCKIS